MSLRSDLKKIDINYWENNVVRIKPLETVEELIYAAHNCELTEEQKEMVSPVWFSIGRAYLYREDNYPCIIYNLNSEPIGFINFFKWVGNEEAYSWSYFIELKYQGNGYGKSTAHLAINILRKSNPNMKIKLSAEKENTKTHKLYLSLGFSKSSETDGDDIVFTL